MIGVVMVAIAIAFVLVVDQVVKRAERIEAAKRPPMTDLRRRQLDTEADDDR